MRPSISVVLPMYRVRDRLVATLRSLEAQTLSRERFECIFVDDHSADGTLESLTAHRPQIDHQILRNPANLGRSRTRNRGWRAARADIVVFLDGDMIAHPRLLESYLDQFSTGTVDVVSGRRHCLDLRGRADHGDAELARLAGRWNPKELFARDANRDFAKLRNGCTLGQIPTQEWLERDIEEVCRNYPQTLTRALAFITSNVAVRRAALENTHGFLPLLARGEDTELGLQLARAGARFAYAADAEAIHPFSGYGGSAEESTSSFEAWLTLHPYTAVVLWWIWWLSAAPPDPGAPGAQRRSWLATRLRRLGNLAIESVRVRASLGRLVDYARAEAERALAETDDANLQRAGRALMQAAGVGLPLQFSRLVHVAQAEASGAIANVDIVERARERGVRIPADLTLARTDLIAHWRRAYGLAEDRAAAYLDRAVAEGVLHASRCGDRYFDRALTTNWLRERTDVRQYVYERSFFRAHVTARQRGNPDARPLVVRWRGRYEVSIARDVLRSQRNPVVASLPLPIATRCQDDVWVGDFTPPGLAACAKDGMLVGIPVPATADPVVRLGYSFRCRVHEWDRALPRRDEETLSTWLRPVGPPARAAGLSNLLAAMPGAAVGSARARASAIYEQLLGETCYQENALDLLTTARTGVGHCIQLSTLYVALCRLAGIPARTRRGALFTWHREAGEALAAFDENFFTPFAHAWAEVHLADTGWTPVELLPISHGRRAVTPHNFPDRELRDRFVAETDLYDRYYFGGLDPFRIHTGELMLPTLLARGEAWNHVGDARLACRHALEATGTRETGA
jgi:GT2 family glycosyltransferase